MDSKQENDIRAVIFDFDNTLVNTKKAIEDAYTKIFYEISKKHGVKIEDLWSEIMHLEEERGHNPDNAKNNYDRHAWFSSMAKDMKLIMRDEEVDHYAELFYSIIKDGIEFSEHTEYVLKAIKASGKKLALLTEKDDAMPGFKEKRVRTMPFSRHFDKIVIAGESIPERKLETAAFSKTAALLNEAPEKTVMIGDRLDIDIEHGKEAGFKTVLFNSYGDPHSGKHSPDYIISDIREVLKLI